MNTQDGGEARSDVLAVSTEARVHTVRSACGSAVIRYESIYDVLGDIWYGLVNK